MLLKRLAMTKRERLQADLEELRLKEEEDKQHMLWDPMETAAKFIAQYKFPTEDPYMLKLTTIGRTPQLPDYERKVVLDTLVCSKTTRYSVK